MAIVSSDIKFKLSTKSGTAGNSLSQSNPNNSLGKYMSTSDMSASLNGLFDNISGADNLNSTVDYRCIFVHNSHATLTLYAAKVYVSSSVSGGAAAALAVDSITAKVITSTAAMASSIASETVAPTGVGAFSAPTTGATGLDLGDIPPGYARAIWVRRSAADTAALSNDGFTLAVTGDTSA